MTDTAIKDDLERYCDDQCSQDDLLEAHDAFELGGALRDKLNNTNKQSHAMKLIALLSHVVGMGPGSNENVPYVVEGFNEALAEWIRADGRVGLSATQSATNITHGVVTAPEMYETDEKSGEEVIAEKKAILNEALLDRLASMPDRETLAAIDPGSLYPIEEKTYEVLSDIMEFLGPNDDFGLIDWIADRGLSAPGIDLEANVLIPYFEDPLPQAIPLFERLKKQCQSMNRRPIELIATLCFSDNAALQREAKDWGQAILESDPGDETQATLREALPMGG